MALEERLVAEAKKGEVSDLLDSLVINDIDRLEFLISRLEDRLSNITRPLPLKDDAPANQAIGDSQLGAVVAAAKNRVSLVNTRIEQLLDSLEN